MAAPHVTFSLTVPRGSYFSGRTPSSARVEAVPGTSWDSQGSCNGLGLGSLEMCYRFVELGLEFSRDQGGVGSKRYAVEKIASKLGA